MSDNATQLCPEYTRYTQRQRFGVTAGVILGLLMVTIDSTIVNVANPILMGNLGATMDEVSWVAIGYMLTNVILLPLTGWLEVRFGRRRVLVFSVALFTASSFLCGTATSLGLLIFYRFLQGAGGAPLLSTGQSTLLDVYPPEKAGVASAVVGIGAMVGPAIGPLLGGYLIDNYSWPWIFFINIIPGIVGSIVLWTMVKESQMPADTTKPIDVSGIILLCIWLGCLQVMLEKGERQGWTESAFIKWLFILSVIGMVMFFYRSLTARYPVVNLRVLKHRALAGGAICSFIYGVAMFSSLFVLPVFLQSIRGYTAQQSGAIMLNRAVATMVAMAICGVIFGKVSSRLLITIGAICSAASVYAMNSVTLLTGPEHIFWPQVFLGFGTGFTMVPLMAAALAGLTGSELGDGSGLLNMIRQLGGTIGIALTSTILSQRMMLHNTMIAEHVNIYRPEVFSRFNTLQRFFMSKGSSVDVAQHKALAVLNRSILGQAVVMSYEDLFLLVAIAFALMLPFIFLLRDPRPGDSKREASMH